jgi:large subunit ribosomal protein L29
MKMTEVRALKDEDLKVQADNLRRELFDTRFKGAVEQIAHPARLRDIRRDVARIETVLRERALGAKKAAEPKPAPPKAAAKRAAKPKAAPKKAAEPKAGKS